MSLGGGGCTVCALTSTKAHTSTENIRVGM